MRAFISITLFALALVLAACGGGGGSRIVPSTGGGSAPNQPATAKTTHASISLYVPPANKQNARAKPFYISANTQAFVVYVEPYPSVAPTDLPSPAPSGVQIFPVATPSPCAVASGGGYQCTLTVTAPVGTDLFIVAAINGTSLAPGTKPLSAFISGPVAVSLSPSPGASPLSFTLNGVVNSAAIAVPIPDPHNTPNTQVFTALVPTAAPLAITAYDADGNMVMSPATQPFFVPIVINASPAADGVTLSLINSTQCGSTASGAQASIGCAADLDDVQASYDGSTHPDSTDHAIGAFSIAATAEPNASPVPSPANIVLASNVATYQVESGTYVNNGFLIPITGGQLLYAFEGGSPEIGTFTPSTATVSAPVTLSTIDYLSLLAVAPNGGTLWAMDGDSGDLDCWSSVSSALSGAPPVVTGIAPVAPDEFTISVSALTVDSANNLWFSGFDTETGNQYAGYYSAASGCPATPPAITAQFALNNDTYDTSPFAAPLANGMAFGSSNGQGIYEVTTGSSSPVNAIVPVSAPSPNSGGVATDPAGNAYAAFTNYNNGTADLEWVSSGALSSLLPLVPTSNSVDGLNASPYGLAVFSPTNAIADRAAYADDDFLALGLVENLHATPATSLAALPNGYSTYQTAYGPNGQAYILYLSYNGSNYALNIARAVTTTTWSVPATSVGGGGCSSGALLSINERIDSGPFSIVASPAANLTITQLPGSDHDYFAAPPDGSSTVQLTITDVNGRQLVVPSFTASEGQEC